MNVLFPRGPEPLLGQLRVHWNWLRAHHARCGSLPSDRELCVLWKCELSYVHRVMKNLRESGWMVVESKKKAMERLYEQN